MLISQGKKTGQENYKINKMAISSAQFHFMSLGLIALAINIIG